jgi:hypothetical protein
MGDSRSVSVSRRCHFKEQGEILDELRRDLQEVLGMLLEDGEPKLESEFVGVQLRRAWDEYFSE